MKPGRTWAALDVEYRTRDEEILGLRREVGKLLVAAWWPALICECKKGGPTLTATVDVRELANEIGDDRPDAEIGAMLQRFVDRALLSVASGSIEDGIVALRLVAGDDWQVAAGTKRSRKSRAKASTDDDTSTDEPKKAPRKKPAQKRKPAAAAKRATPTQRHATPRNDPQRSRARTDSDSETETDTDSETVSDTESDSLAFAPAREAGAADPLRPDADDQPPVVIGGTTPRKRGRLATNVEASVERLIDALGAEGEDGRAVFFDLAHRGAAEADFADALGAIRAMREGGRTINSPASYAYRTITNRLDRRAGRA